MEEKNVKTRGGTHEQHVKAGRAGGKAHHTCRGRQCTEEEANRNKEVRKEE